MSDYNSFDEYGFYGENNGPLADPRYYEDPEDIVDKPQHYARWKIEPITFIMGYFPERMGKDAEEGAIRLMKASGVDMEEVEDE